MKISKTISIDLELINKIKEKNINLSEFLTKKLKEHIEEKEKTTHKTNDVFCKLCNEISNGAHSRVKLKENFHVCKICFTERHPDDIAEALKEEEEKNGKNL